MLTVLMTVNVLSIFKNPMILLGLVSMGVVFGMPYLMDNSKSTHTSFCLSPLFSRFDNRC